MSTLRKAFIERLQSLLYSELPKQYSFLGEWDPSQRYALAIGIVDDKMAEIEKYLDTHNVTIKTSNSAAREILLKILLPEVEKLKI